MLFLLLGVEADQSPQDLLIPQTLHLFLNFLGEKRHMFLYFFGAFLHRLIVACDGLGNFLLKIREEAFHKHNHLVFRLPDPFLELLLLFYLFGLLLAHVFLAVLQLFDNGFEAFGEVGNCLVDAGLRGGYFSNWP